MPRWVNEENSNMKAPYPVKNNRFIARPIRKARTRNNDGGASGIAPADSKDFSRRAKSPPTTTAARSRTTASQIAAPAENNVIETMKAASARPSRIAPQRSIDSGASDLVGRTSRIRAKEIDATPAARNITGRQLSPNRSAVSSAPLAIWPTTVPMPAMAAYLARAMVRFSPLEVAWIVERICGSTRPIPMPCSTRATISKATELLSPAPTDATAKTNSPQANTLRRPNRSPKRPARISTAASTVV
jgi:hypothetical protein